MELHSKKEALPLKIFKRLGKKDKYEIELTEQLSSLSMQAIQYISILRSAEIPMSYWQSDAMNWVLVRWGQKQHMDYHILFDKYDAYVEQNRTSTEKLKLRSQNKQFQNTLKKLLSYAVA